jgi:hypothetical protein
MKTDEKSPQEDAKLWYQLTRDRAKIVLTAYDTSINYELKIEKKIQEEKK